VTPPWSKRGFPRQGKLGACGNHSFASGLRLLLEEAGSRSRSAVGLPDSSHFSIRLLMSRRLCRLFSPKIFVAFGGGVLLFLL
jgi:hypothetical protein